MLKNQEIFLKRHSESGLLDPQMLKFKRGNPVEFKTLNLEK